MAVVDRMIPLPEFGVPMIMPSFRVVASEMAAPGFKYKIYVAAGKDVKEGIAKLVWTVHQSGGNVKICIIHVLVPSRTIPMGLGAEMPAKSASGIMLREHREKERINMQKILHTYLSFCKKLGVLAETEYIEADNVEKGIVELIRLHGIKKLVMGAAADKRYFKKMTELKSRKAIFVRDKAPFSCQIRFICAGHFIHTREAQTVQAIGEVPIDAPSPATPSTGAGKSVLSKSRSATPQMSGTAKFSNPSQDVRRRAFSSNANRCTVMPIASPSPDNTPSEQPNAASIMERQDTFQELATSPTHPPQLIQSVYHSCHSSLSNTLDVDEKGVREVLEEGVMTRAEAEVEIIEGGRDDPRKIELNNALQKAEEVSRREEDSSGTKYFSEFSMTEIKEATQNFDPSLKIGEGGCGSVYRGFLRHTLVAVKIMKFHSMQNSQEFQQEVNVLSKMRHPNLITLMGACPEPCTLVYEYIPNGSLEDWLCSSNRAKQMPWHARIRIATELCSVLAFLHSCKPHSIVHGDVKPANILLDAHLGSKLSDFGICRLLSSGDRSSNNTTVLYTTNLKGTLGYMDPEILVTRELTTKFDVYSFGIILLQLLTRRPALGIAEEVKSAISAGTLEAILDPLAGEWPYMVAKELTHLGLRCCEMSRSNRPDLRSDVWTVLQSVVASCR